MTFDMKANLLKMKKLVITYYIYYMINYLDKIHIKNLDIISIFDVKFSWNSIYNIKNYLSGKYLNQILITSKYKNVF